MFELRKQVERIMAVQYRGALLDPLRKYLVVVQKVSRHASPLAAIP